MSSLRVYTNDILESAFCDCRQIIITLLHNDAVFPKLATDVGGGFIISLPHRLMLWPFQAHKIKTGLFVSFSTPRRCALLLSLEGTERYLGHLFLSKHIFEKDGELVLEVINFSYTPIEIPPMTDFCKFFIIDHRGDVILRERVDGVSN